ncbi:MAG TPA: serine hydrolase domain-containing protein, partial [Gemmatimonadaceae bacterium]|nr:serine hydrolase domain-containing protein [Gemmatimonadaceae bacterium]
MKSRIPSLLLLAGAASPLAAQVPVDAAQRVDAIFATYATPASPGCIVGVGREGKQVYAKAYGMANLEYNVPLTVESISESGSVAKQFTAAALALLHLEGKLSLDDDIRKYLPEVPDFGARITIRHLLNHTSGIRDQWALWGLADRGPGSEVHTIPEVLDLVRRQRDLNFQTGSEHLYSNTGYTLASVIVTRVAGMPFARFTQERLFKPLGMNHTQWRDDYRRVVPNRATAYSREGTAWVQNMPFTMVHGNGGLLTTVGDLLIWNDALDQGLLGKPELTRLLETKGKLNSGRELDYALGLTVGEARPGIRAISHGGSTAGYRTYLVRYPEAGRLSVALLCNAANANAGALAQRVANVYLPAAVAAARDTAPSRVSAEERARLVATYRNPVTDDWFNVAANAEALQIVGPATDPLTLEAAATYRARSGRRFRFEPAQGVVRQAILIFEGDSATFEVVQRPELSASQLAEYAGDYYSPELGTTLRLRVDAGRLLLRSSPDEEVALVPFYRDGFRVG